MNVEITQDQMRAEMTRMGVPEHIHDGFIRYFYQGIPTGSGIRRVLENGSLFDAIAGLDDECVGSLRAIVKFIYNFAPGQSHGSPEAVSAWIAAHQKARAEISPQGG